MAAPLVLCYHAVSPDWPADLSVTPEDLRSQLEHLVRRGYRGVTFAQVATGNNASKAVAVTFDDGYRSVYDLAFPILEDLGLPGTVFVPAAHVGQSHPMSWPGIERWVGTPYEGELDCMSWDQLRELADHGWEVGSHTLSHPRLPELDDATLQRELTESREICADQMGKPCGTLAYPYGADDERVRVATRDAGYEAAAVLRLGEPSRFSWPRVGIYNLDGAVRFRFKVSPAVRRVRSTSVGRTLERGRTILRRHPS
jgi:peptidoglycan/xylan/chitin deacetylase (PgdA/CDA1 family)